MTFPELFDQTVHKLFYLHARLVSTGAFLIVRLAVVPNELDVIEEVLIFRVLPTLQILNAST